MARKTKKKAVKKSKSKVIKAKVIKTKPLLIPKEVYVFCEDCGNDYLQGAPHASFCSAYECNRCGDMSDYNLFGELCETCQEEEDNEEEENYVYDDEDEDEDVEDDE